MKQLRDHRQRFIRKTDMIFDTLCLDLFSPHVRPATDGNNSIGVTNGVIGGVSVRLQVPFVSFEKLPSNLTGSMFMVMEQDDFGTSKKPSMKQPD
jgi:hypothetical protein